MSVKPNSDSKMTDRVLIGIGTAVVCVVGILCVLGTRSAVNAMQKTAQDGIVEQVARLKADEDAAKAQVVEPEVVWVTEQLLWMNEDHIVYNEDAFPVDANGNVVDDPTTRINEVTKWNDLQAALAEPTPEPTVEPTPTPIPTPEPVIEEVKWWADLPMIEQDEDGRLYYVVQKGDTIEGIAKKTGFAVSELVDYNGIKKSSIIKIGQRIYFPLEGPTVAVENRNVGLG